jgi:steroid delta-isomerase-like uncharacterized protein
MRGMGNDSNRALVRRFVDVVNAHDVSAVDEVLAEEFRLPPGDDGLDRSGLKAVLQYYFTAFPDLHYSIEDLVSEGDRVVARVRMSGTHEGDYDGQPGTGRHFDVEEVDIFNLSNDRIASYRTVWDELGFRRQLGLPLA